MYCNKLLIFLIKFAVLKNVIY